MHRMFLVATLFLAAFFVGCTEYLPPPGGVEAYCWRVEAKSPAGTWSLVFYTNDRPTENTNSVTVTNAYLAWNVLGRKIRGSRFDRHITTMVLDRNAFRELTMRQTTWCRPKK